MREHVFGTTSSQDEQGLEVHPDNWRAVELFCFCTTQWACTDSGVRLGLNYAAVHAVFNMFSIPPRQHASLISDIRLIELGALIELREQAEASHGT